MINIGNVQQRSRDLGTLRLLYLIYFGAIGIFFTFIAVYYKSLGLNGTQIGIIGMLGPLAGIGGMMVWGILNDRFGRTRLFLAIACVGASAFAMILSAMRTFEGIIVAVCCYSLFAAAIGPLLDSTTLGLLGTEGAQYGRYRVWGTVGYLITSASAGFVLQRIGIHAIFPGYAIVICLMLPVIARLPSQPVQLGQFSFQGLAVMLRQPTWLVFTGSIFLVGLAFSGTMNFLSVTMRVMGAGEALIGLSWTMAAVPELPIMLFGAIFLRRIGSERLILTAFALYGVRTLLYSIMPSPLWAAPINAVFGSAFGLLWIGAVNYVNERAPQEVRTTAQSMLTSTTNLANVVGSVTSGRLFDSLGPAGLFRALTFCSLAAFLLFGSAQLTAHLRKGQQPALVLLNPSPALDQNVHKGGLSDDHTREN